MPNRVWPVVGKIASGWKFGIEAHTRGTATPEGVGVWSRGGGARFVGQIPVAPMSHADALAFRAFRHSLRGRSGAFTMVVPGTENALAGTAVLSGSAAQDASSVTLGSIVNSSALVAGAYATIGDVETTGQLVQVVSVAGSTIEFRPRLRASKSGGDAVTFGQVQGLFRATDFPVVPIQNANCPGLVVTIEEFR